MKKSLFSFLLLTFTVLFFPFTSIAAGTSPENHYASLPGKLVKVSVKFHINKITEIDEINQTFKVDGYLYATWNDKRLQFKQAEGVPKDEPKIYGKEEALAMLGKEIWWPVLEFINIASPRERPNVSIDVFPDGQVRYVERFIATLNSSMNLRKFPFDSQNFKILIESYDYGSNELLFELEESKKNYDEDLLNTEWIITKVAPEVTEHVYDSIDEKYSQFSININADRKYGFYLWKIFLPLVLIVGVSFVVFWISDIGIQVGTVQTILLTVVAFNFIISGMLPKISYITFIDSIINTCYIIICLTLIEVVLYYKIVKKNLIFWKRMIKNARWVFPACSLAAIFIQIKLFL